MARGFVAPLCSEYRLRACVLEGAGINVGVATANLVPGGSCGVRIFAEGMRVALRKNLHHPAIKVIHRVVHDGFEPPVVFSMSFLNVITQSDADIFVLPAEAHLLRS